MNIEQKSFENGQKALFVNSPGSTAAGVQIWFRAGSALEDKEDQGIAHFLEHMFFKGTPTRPGSAIASEVESFGGEINAFTSFDYTCYYINCPASKLDKSLEILMDMVSNPMFKEEELIPERGVVFEEFRRSLDNPNQFGFKKIQNSFFKGKYNHQILGTEQTIKSFSQDQLHKFRNAHYNIANSLIVVAGNIDNASPLEKIIKSNPLPNGPKTNFEKFTLKTGHLKKIYNFDVRMAQVTLLLQAPEYEDSISATEDLAMNCLGYGESSRLHKAIVRESSLGNSCSASTMFFSKGGAHFMRVTCPPENLSKVYTTFLKVLRDLKKNPFTKKEVTRIKNQYTSSKIYDKESLESFTFSLGHSFAQNGDIHSEEKFIEKIKNIDTDEINETIKDIFSRPAKAILKLPKGEKQGAYNKALEDFSLKLSKVFPPKKKQSKEKKIALTSSKFDPSTKVIEIKKGITLIHRLNDMTPTFILQSYIKGGLSDESENQNGKYYLMSSLISKGYKGMSYPKLKEDLENRSSSLSGFSGKNAYGLNMHGLSESSNELFEHFFKTLLTPSFSAKQLSHEKEMVKRSLLSEQEDPVRQLFKSISKTIFPQHPYGKPSNGTLDTVKKISSKLLTETHDSNLKKKNIVITYCGNESLEVVKAKTEQYLSSLKARSEGKVSLSKQKNIFNKKVKLDFKREQAQIFIGLPGFKFSHKNDFYLKMLTYHLSGQSSELFVEVRDRQGLCYAVQPVHFSALEGGYWGIYIGSGNDKKEKAIEAINKILNRLEKEGLNEEEFSNVKTMIEGQSQLNIQTNEDYAGIYSVPVLHSFGVDHHYKINEAIKKVTLSEFNTFLSTFLAKKKNIFIAG